MGIMMQNFQAFGYPLDIKITQEPVNYIEAVEKMEALVAQMIQGHQQECIWLLEHDPVYTGGVRAQQKDILDLEGVPYVPVRRGGRVTYHGPGQRVIYFMLDLNKRGRDLRQFIRWLEALLIATLNDLGIHAFAHPDRIGIWTHYQNQALKIGAIGVQVRKWVTFHGVAINVHPDLEAFQRIIPCGLKDFPVGSLQMLNPTVTMPAFDAVFLRQLAHFTD